MDEGVIMETADPKTFFSREERTKRFLEKIL